MPLLMAAPMKIPIEAIMIMCFNGAALDPMAEFKKFTASLLTPTERSNTANKNRNTIRHRNKISIIFFFCAKKCLFCFKNISKILTFN